ncbi:MAG TPA: DinB family protein [Vicinamibacterales bacterium]|nr:DinB family protein [Vicinamibacterales bacterium]
MSAPEPWLRGPVDGIAPVLMPAAHALLQANEDVATLAPTVSVDLLWRAHGAATAGFHLIHLAGALDRIFTYARGEMLNDAQKAAAKAEAVAHPERDGAALARIVDEAIQRALAQLRATPAERVLDERRVGRAGLPSTVLGCLFHGAEHSTRHSGQFITTIKIQSSL